MKSRAILHLLVKPLPENITAAAMRLLPHRLGEPAALAIIENWERHAGIKTDALLPYEQRWSLMMRGQKYYRA